MACNCNVPVAGYVFPILGLQPLGPKENWPVYFVPTKDDVGAGIGYYYCPGCHAGLNEAREAAGMKPVEDASVLSWFENLMKATQQVWIAVFSSIYLPTTAGKSR